MLTQDGKPNLTSAPVKSTVEHVKSLNDAGVISPGFLTMKEQDKVEKFTNGQVGMVIDSLAHINLIKKNNPKLNFTVAAIPAEDSYTGQRGIPYASWGIGISSSTKHKAEAFKLVQYMMSQQTNAQLSTLANGFPGNKTAEPDFSKSDPLFKTAFDIYKQGYPANEVDGRALLVQRQRDRRAEHGLHRPCQLHKGAHRRQLPGGAEEHVDIHHLEHCRSPRPRLDLRHAAEHAVAGWSNESDLPHRVHHALAVHDRRHRRHLATAAGPGRGGQLHPDRGGRGATRGELALQPEYGTLGTDLHQHLVGISVLHDQ